MLISICEDNYAIYDEKENKIKFGYGDKGAVGSMLVPEGKKVTDLCITEHKCKSLVSNIVSIFDDGFCLKF